MKCLCFPKTWLWPSSGKNKSQGARGSLTLISVFVFFVFSALGLGLIYLSQAYLKLSAFKKNITLSDFSSENGIKQGFAQLAGLASERRSPLILSEGYYQELKQNSQGGGVKIAEEALSVHLPVQIEETWGGQAWSCSTQFLPTRFIESEDYCLAEFHGEIRSKGRLKSSVYTRESSLEVCLKTLAGRIPLSYFPFLVTQNLDPARIRDFEEKHHIVFLPLSTNQVSPTVSFSSLPLVPDEAGPLLTKALNIKIFSPEKLSTAELRAALGLEPTSDPIPQGVYLIKNDLGLGGVYVHGDIEEMVLAVQAGFQVVSFRLNAERWVLRYNPAQSQTQFATPTGTQNYDLVPLGIIMVNGRINSLGGGILDSSDQAVLVRNEEIPSILQGISLTIVSSDQTALSSHLIHQGLKWQNGIPYLKDSKSQLIVYSTGKDFLSDEDRQGRIIIDANAPADVKIQASLTASDGFRVEGGGKTAFLIGGLQTSSLEMGENTRKIAPDERLLTNSLAPQNSPVTTSPLLLILGLIAVQWNEF